MHGGLSSLEAAMEKEKLSSVCPPLSPVSPGEFSTNFSSHSFRPKRKGPVWGWRLPTPSSKRTAGHSREKIVTKAERVLRSVSRKQERTSQRRPSSFGGGKIEDIRSPLVSRIERGRSVSVR